jgi:hypothetical protein
MEKKPGHVDLFGIKNKQYENKILLISSRKLNSAAN